MKKALVILLALSMVFGAFADPDVTVSVTEFKGEAEFGWKADLEGETTGMYNKDSASLKIQFIDKEATRSTEGEGLWGELVIKAGDKVELEAGKDAWTIPSVKVDTAKIHFVDGDTYVRMSILKPGFAVGGIGYTKATDADGDKDKFGGAEVLKDAGYNGFTLEAGIPMVDVVVAFGDNGVKKSDAKEYGFKGEATIKPIADLEIYGGVACASAEDDAAFAAKASYKLALNDTFYVKPIVSYAQKGDAKPFGVAVLFGWGADGLEPGFKKAADVAGGISDEDLEALLAFFGKDKATVEAAVDDEISAGTDTGDYAEYWIKDAAGATAEELEAWVKAKKAKDVAAAKKSVTDALEGLSELAAADVSSLNVNNKCADGVSFAFGKDLGNDADKGSIAINAYDSTFVPGLKVGAKFGAKADKMGEGALAAAVKYGNDFGILTLDADFAFGVDLSEDEDNTAMSYAVKLSTDDIIANTTLFAEYDGKNASVFGTDTKGTITLGAKISF